jgi:hypothetical protein
LYSPESPSGRHGKSPPTCAGDLASNTNPTRSENQERYSCGSFNADEKKVCILRHPIAILGLYCKGFTQQPPANFATFAAIRRASSRLSSLATDPAWFRSTFVAGAFKWAKL